MRHFHVRNILKNKINWFFFSFTHSLSSSHLLMMDSLVKQAVCIFSRLQNSEGLEDVRGRGCRAQELALVLDTECSAFS